jgi:single-strand DNA-binding protein
LKEIGEMINRVVLVGRLTRDPEIKYTPSGVAMATMGVAVDKGIARDKQREGEPTADFFNVVAWRHSAEFASNYLNKGRLVGIDGRLQQRSWVDQQGQKRSVVEVVADRIQGLDRREDGEGGAAPRTGGMGGGRAPEEPQDNFSDFGGDDFDPFADQ